MEVQGHRIDETEDALDDYAQSNRADKYLVDDATATMTSSIPVVVFRQLRLIDFIFR